MKKYTVNFNIGKVKYLVNFHNGAEFYKDNSEFYNIKTFKNKNKMNNFIKELESNNYCYV